MSRAPKLCPITELAELFGVDVRTMRDWLQGLPADVPGKSGRGNAALWTVTRLITHKFLRGESSATGADLDLDQERARQAKASADKLELENAVRRGEFAPVEIFDSAFMDYTRQVTSMLDGLEPNLRRILPHLSESDYSRIHNHIASERERIAARLQSGLDADAENGDQGGTVMAATA
jgi:phage terminase Nu1 subunit (DNA packaging protein)